MAARRTLFARGTAKGRNVNTGAIQGLVVTNLSSFLDQARQVNKRTAQEAGNIILRNTLPKTPKATGKLRDSGHVKVGRTESGNDKVEVTFGNAEVDYAVFVHEDMPRDVEKTYTTSGTGPKYLQIGAAESIDEIRDMVVRRMQQHARNASGKGGRRKR